MRQTPAGLLTSSCIASPAVQWAEEIERHVAPGQLKWCRYVPSAAAAAAAEQEDAEEGRQPRQRRSRRVAEAGDLVSFWNCWGWLCCSCPCAD